MVNNIVEIYNENNDVIPYVVLEIKYEKTPHSSVFSKILYIDNVPIIGNKRNTYKVKFKCNCGNCSTISLKYFLSKNEIHCNKCSNRKNVHKYNNINIKIIEHNFNNYSDNFQEKYWKRHLHSYEFDKYKYNIISINKKNIIDYNHLVYYEHELINNQNIFTSFISFDNGKTKESIKSIELKCSICGKIFSIYQFNLRNHDPQYIKCRKCNFQNTIYELKQYKNTSLTYQSLLEKKFLDKCFENNIQVLNGLEIPYFFKGKLRTYITDFYLPKLKYIIEIKGSNPYYYKDLNKGKIKAKNDAAIKYANKYNLRFEFILDNIDIFFEKNLLLIYS